MYVVLFLLASTLSLAFYGYFYALCLLHIIVNNDILQRVLRAVTQNGGYIHLLPMVLILLCSLSGIVLLWVAALGGVVLYIYAVISFAFLHESADNEADSNRDNDLFCDTLGQCFITVIRYGLIDNLGLVGCCSQTAPVNPHICLSGVSSGTGRVQNLRTPHPV